MSKASRSGGYRTFDHGVDGSQRISCKPVVDVDEGLPIRPSLDAFFDEGSSSLARILVVLFDLVILFHLYVGYSPPVTGRL